MAVTYASSLLSGEAVCAELTGIFSGFRAALEEETGTGERRRLWSATAMPGEY